MNPAIQLCIGVTRGDPGCTIDANLPEEIDEQDPILIGKANGAPSELTKPKDVFSLIARQMQYVTSPEGIVNFGIEAKQRATASEIGETSSQSQVQKGPANTPAFLPPQDHRVPAAAAKLPPSCQNSVPISWQYQP